MLSGVTAKATELSPTEELGRQVRTCVSEFSHLGCEVMGCLTTVLPLLSLMGAAVRVVQLAGAQAEPQKFWKGLLHVQVPSEQR